MVEERAVVFVIDEGLALPVFFITGHGDIPMSVRAMKAGAVEFLTKPFHDKDLLDAIHAAIEHDQKGRRAARALRDAYRARAADHDARRHRGQVMRKMHAESLPEVVRMADRPAQSMATS